MLKYNSTINALQKLTSSFDFTEAESYAEAFAQARYRKKMEVPNTANDLELARKCTSEWISTDMGLPDLHLLPGEWYKARQLLHDSLRPVRLTRTEFPKGSEFEATNGRNSIEARLSESRWTCTHDNFEVFSKVCYEHKALKRAVRSRYTKWFHQKGFDITERRANQYLYTRFESTGCTNIGLAVFKWKLSRIVKIVHGSRFTTIPKNNKQRRPINIEPFGNIVTQRAVGLDLKDQLHRIFGVNLDDLAKEHRQRISLVDLIATIDLKNASDSVLLKLCEFLLPRNVYTTIVKTRSSMVLVPELDPDGSKHWSWHVPKKVSSMGCGFTFELMTLILTAICRTLDPTATVFGDDIIIAKEHSQRLITLLEAVGFQINKEKSFIDGPFRESCGANYHMETGYIESYDFQYPLTIGDCVLLVNKCARLAPLYPSFNKLYKLMLRCVPIALQGGPNYDFQVCDTLDLIALGFTQDVPDVDFPTYFVTLKQGGAAVNTRIKDSLSKICYDSYEFKQVVGFEFKSRLRSQTVKHLEKRRHWAKYEMYLAAGRRSKDVLTDQGEWVEKLFVTSGVRTFRASALMT